MKKHSRIKTPGKHENAAIQRGIEKDVENPEWTDEDFSRARPARESLHEYVGEENANAHLNQRGRPPKLHPKERITIRLDADLLEWLKNQGPGYQSKINSILRDAMEHG
ncbi:MAG: antitoxin [bacterium]|nr:antitoxin [bacterium]